MSEQCRNITKGKHGRRLRLRGRAAEIITNALPRQPRQGWSHVEKMKKILSSKLQLVLRQEFIVTGREMGSGPHIHGSKII